MRAQRDARGEGEHQQHHRAQDQQHRAQAIFPEGRAEFHAIGTAQDVADRLDEACRGPQADDRSEPQQRPGARREHLLDRFAQRVRDVGRQPAENVEDGQLRILALAEQMRDRGGEDEEGKQREDARDRRDFRRG